MPELIKHYHPLPAESDLRMTSMQIAELCGKRHDHVLRDIDALIQPSPELGQVENEDVFELKFRKTGGGEKRYFEMDEATSILVVSGYNADLRRKIIKEWRFYREAYHNRQWRSDDVELQKRVMGVIKQALEAHQSPAEKLDYIKANTIVDKAVSNLYGFEKMVKKVDMSMPMLEDRQRVLSDYEKLFSFKPDSSWVKEAVYAKYQQLKLEDATEND